MYAWEDKQNLGVCLIQGEIIYMSSLKAKSNHSFFFYFYEIYFIVLLWPLIKSQ